MANDIFEKDEYKLNHAGEELDENIDEVVAARGEYSSLSERLSNIGGGGVGEDVTGREFVVDTSTLTAKEGAEIFNDYTNNKAIGKFSHAEGNATVSKSDYSHAEGNGSTASDKSAHAEGYTTTASGEASHAEGYTTTASGMGSHSEGQGYTVFAQYCYV